MVQIHNQRQHGWNIEALSRLDHRRMLAVQWQLDKTHKRRNKQVTLEGSLETVCTNIKIPASEAETIENGGVTDGTNSSEEWWWLTKENNKPYHTLTKYISKTKMRKRPEHITNIYSIPKLVTLLLCVNIKHIVWRRSSITPRLHGAWLVNFVKSVGICCSSVFKLDALARCGLSDIGTFVEPQ